MSSLTVVALDIKGSHEKNSTCEMRIAPHPTGNHWYCVDCGIAIIAKQIEAGSVPIKKMELYPENFVASFSKREAFLLDDDQLNETLKAGAYRGHQYRVYLDTFVCTREQQDMEIHGGPHKVKGVANFPAHAAKVGVELPEGYSEDAAEAVFAGNLHLAVFANKEFIWAVKNLALADVPYETVTKDVLYLNVPAFLATGIIDKQGDTGRPRVSAVEVND